MEADFEWYFGSDPEFTIRGLDAPKGLSAIRILGNGKKDPIMLGNDQSVFYDNVLLEGNIKAAKTCDEFCKNFQSWYKDVKEILGSEYKLKLQASEFFDISELKEKQAKEIGCDPEYSIWKTDASGDMERIIHEPFGVKTRRTAGGHIHVGHPSVNIYEGGDVARFIRMMDLFVGIPSILLDHDPTSSFRRDIYGGAGYHRPTDYGAEYRSLSNFWLASPRLVNVIYSLTSVALALVDANLDSEIWTSIDNPVAKIKDTINFSKKTEAEVMWEMTKDYLFKNLQDEVELHFEDQGYDFDDEWTNFGSLIQVAA